MPTNSDDIAVVIARVSQRYDVSHAILLGMVAKLTGTAAMPPLARLERRLVRRIPNVQRLRTGLAQSVADEALAGWRRAAASAVDAGQFIEVDKALAQAEFHILAGAVDLAELAPERRIAAGEMRALRGEVSKLGLTQQHAREAAQRFAEAVAIVGRSDPARSHAFGLRQANALILLAEEWSSQSDYEAAIAHLRQMLGQLDNFEDTIRWAEVQERLGVALAGLGGLRGDRALLREAAACYRTALEDVRREHDLPLWARLQRHLGRLALELGEAQDDRALIEEAVEALRAAASVMERASDAPAWAAAQFDLGRALSALGRRSAGLADLEAAYNALNCAGQFWTRDVAPARWADIQDRMGAVLATMGGSYNETVVLEEAVAAFGRALEVRRRETDLPAWASSMAGRAEATMQLARRGKELGLAQQALSQLVEAMEAARGAGDAALAAALQTRLVAAGAMAQALAGG